MKFNLYKDKVIRHELGHWLAARELGFDVGDIEIKILKNRTTWGHKGAATILPCHDIEGIEDLKDYVANRIAILFSGILSQVMAKDEAEVDSCLVEELLATDGVDDNSKIIELTHILRGSIYNGNMNNHNELEQRNEIMKTCWGKAYTALEKNKDVMEDLLNKISIEITDANKKYIFNKSRIEEWVAD